MKGVDARVPGRGLVLDIAFCENGRAVCGRSDEAARRAVEELQATRTPCDEKKDFASNIFGRLQVLEFGAPPATVMITGRFAALTRVRG
jgi:hypothetical protein